MILAAVNDKSFKKMDYAKIVAAADDMVDNACIYEAHRMEYVGPMCEH